MVGSARAPRGGRGQVAARGPRPHRRHRPQPRGHAAARDRVGARHALGEGGRRLHEEGPHARALPRDLRRQHAGRLVPLRRQRLGAPRARSEFGTRCEIKNLNSFRFVERAIKYEVARQIELIEGGGKVVQETRLYDPDRDETRSMRSKEEANDYRYFPDPDLLPLAIDEAFIEEVRARAAGAARCEGGALRARARAFRVRRRRADGEPRAGGLLRGGRGRLRRAEARGELGDGRSLRIPQSRRPRDRASPVRRPRSRAC